MFRSVSPVPGAISSLFLAIALQGCESGGPPEQAATPETAAEPGIAEPAVAEPDRLDAILVGEHRSEENRARDLHRHPKETLQFFGLTEDMQVVEIWPAGGWYTEVIAPYVNENGKYWAAHWDPDSDREFIRDGVARYKEKLAANPELYGNIEMTVLMFPEKLEIAPPESVDMVVTFRNIHNWMAFEFADEIFATMYAALKPGGVLGVVEHRGNPEVPQDPKAASGYVNEDYAIAMAEKAGFVLDAKSEINANPADTKDYEGGVWTLPPTLRLKDQDSEKYLSIGESDRFTLRFIKPAS